ncbi:hypothetical protein H5410_061613 [Solanum commersonii]|uniref:Uncharacterized protein n=1 Tax=Solanum commersonii TaxID=4109 RepID=A0A9J5W956_SOLCO|nr:hypothetical protein H5410_061613 [Solanum commersonii]
MFSPIGLSLFSNRLLIRLTQDKKGLSKACNGAECKCMLSQICAAADRLASIVGIVDQLGDSPFGVVHCCLVPTFVIIMLWPIGRYGLSTLEHKTNVHALFNFKTLKLKDSIINAHNKTQFIYAKIKCALKDSSCNSPISTKLILTILASKASSSSTIVFKCPHTKNDSIFTQWFHNLKFWNQMQRSHSQKRTTLNIKKVFSRLVMGKSAKIFVVADHLASLVGIADQLGYFPFGSVHRHSSQPSISSCFGPLGDESSTHWNKRRNETLRRFAMRTRRSSSVHFFIVFTLFVPFFYVVSMLSFKLQISDT